MAHDPAATRVQRVAGPPVITLDEPADGAVASGHLRVRGWVAAGPGPFSVDAWVDGERLGPLPAGTDRPDVSEALADGTPVACGFEGSLPLAGRAEGPALLRLRAEDAHGRTSVVERRLELRGEGIVPPAPPVAETEPLGFRVLRAGPAGGAAAWPWFEEHYRQAADELLDFLAEDGLSLEGQFVADVGCGDGAIDLGLVHRGRPRELIGFDLEPVDVGWLEREARQAGVLDDGLPPELRFEVCSSTALPAATHSFDAVVSWSTFEHVQEPVRTLREVRRILRPGGVLFLQIWPLFHSQHGGHVWPWFPSGFAHLRQPAEEIEQVVRDGPIGTDADADFIVREARSLNRITIDELQRSLLSAGFDIAKFQLMAPTVRVPADLARYSLADLGIAGVKLLATAG